jgi:hypothetical protein
MNSPHAGPLFGSRKDESSMRERDKVNKRGPTARLRQVVAAFLLLLTCALPSMEMLLEPAGAFFPGPDKPIAGSFISQPEFVVTSASPASAVKHDRDWHSPFVLRVSDLHLTRLPRLITGDGEKLTANPLCHLLVTIQSASEF